MVLYYFSSYSFRLVHFCSCLTSQLHSNIASSLAFHIVCLVLCIISQPLPMFSLPLGLLLAPMCLQTYLQIRSSWTVTRSSMAFSVMYKRLRYLSHECQFPAHILSKHTV